MPTRAQRYGTAREHGTRDEMVADGWVVARAPGSLGAADLICMKFGMSMQIDGRDTRYTRVLLVQVKANVDGGPYNKFGPAEREKLRALAEEINADAWLVHWPHNRGGKKRWIHSDEWPA